MNPFRQRVAQARSFGGFMGAILAVLTGVALFLSALGKPLINASFDWPFRYRTPVVPEEVVIIYMDDYSHAELDQDPSRPWSRLLHAELIERLTRQGARAIVFDVVFSSPASNFLADPRMAEEWDARLTEAMRRHGKVVVAAEYGRLEMEGAVAWRILPIYERVAKAVAAVGHSYTTVSADYTIRLFPEAVDYGGEPFPSLCQAAAQVLGYVDPPHHRTRYVNYFGPPLTLRSESYFTVYRGDTPPGLFKDKVVFIGARQSTGMTGEGKDEFRNPWPRYLEAASGQHDAEVQLRSFSPGTEIQATAFCNLMRKNWMVAIPDSLQLGLLIVFGALTGFGLAMLRPTRAVPVALGVVTVEVGAAIALHGKAAIWFAWLIPPVQVFTATLWSVLFNSVRLYFEKLLAEAEARTEKAEKQRLEAEQKLLEQERALLRETLVKQLSPGRVEQILKNPELLKPGTRKQVISIMFSDIEAYSRLSENLSPDELADQLNAYYELTLGCVHETEGTVVKLIGDAIFAIWNAPFPQEDHARRACVSALLLHGRLAAHDQQRTGPVMRTRVGLNLGEASVGNIGSSQRFDYTAVGDCVNIASRLEGMNKMVGTGVLATQAIRQAVGDQIIFRPVGLFRFKGVTHLQFVYEVVGLPEVAEGSRPWREAFAAAWQLFAQQRWAEAEAAFRHVLTLKPEDGPSLYYLERIHEFQAQPPPPDWQGQIILHEK
ncbi:MAG: CHASE2 domain-containing protein [Verrucomicrobiae bacterium]|nr:CHASE2 domain-containing protein [Verrucomicrobiae bacterium]